MTDKEIIKALECCTNWNITKCFECPYVDYDGSCVNKSKIDALDLINRQQIEIEKMKVRIEVFDKAFDEVFPPEMIEKAKEMAGADNG